MGADFLPSSDLSVPAALRPCQSRRSRRVTFREAVSHGRSHRIKCLACTPPKAFGIQAFFPPPLVLSGPLVNRVRRILIRPWASRYPALTAAPRSTSTASSRLRCCAPIRRRTAWAGHQRCSAAHPRNKAPTAHPARTPRPISVARDADSHGLSERRLVIKLNIPSQRSRIRER